VCNSARCLRNHSHRIREVGSLDHGEAGDGQRGRHEWTTRRLNPCSVGIAYLHRVAGDTHQSPSLPELFVVCMSGIPNLWCGTVISRAIAVSDRHELRHGLLLSSEKNPLWPWYSWLRQPRLLCLAIHAGHIRHSSGLRHARDVPAFWPAGCQQAQEGRWNGARRWRSLTTLEYGMRGMVSRMFHADWHGSGVVSTPRGNSVGGEACLTFEHSREMALVEEPQTQRDLATGASEFGQLSRGTVMLFQTSQRYQPSSFAPCRIRYSVSASVTGASSRHAHYRVIGLPRARRVPCLHDVDVLCPLRRGHDATAVKASR
jgi:hypothetical protein